MNVYVARQPRFGSIEGIGRSCPGARATGAFGQPEDLDLEPSSPPFRREDPMFALDQPNLCDHAIATCSLEAGRPCRSLMRRTSDGPDTQLQTAVVPHSESAQWA